jgi:predicted small secreted protein
MRHTLAGALLTLFILTGVGAMLSACNAVAGAGEDISNTSRGVQRHL